MARGFFITGTDTDVGKTLITTALLHAIRARGYSAIGMKPVASGCAATAAGLRSADAVALIAASSTRPSYDLVNPYAYAPPIAPSIAADRHGTSMEIAPILAAYNGLAAAADVVAVEGVGGWLVPLNARETLADLASALALPVILVVGVRLGCLNHALLTVESIAGHGLTLAGWVANCHTREDAAAEIIGTLTRRIDAPRLGTIPYLADTGAAAETAAPYLELYRLGL